MARKATDLSRRRGTLRRSSTTTRRRRTRRSGYGLGLQLLVCFALVVGMTAGFVVYLLLALVFDGSPSTTTTTTKRSSESSLRKRVHGAHNLVDRLVAHGIVGDDDASSSSSAGGWKRYRNKKKGGGDTTTYNNDDVFGSSSNYGGEEEIVFDKTGLENFLKHKVEIGTSGAFPYYPAAPELVAKDHDFKSFQPKGGKRFGEYRQGDSPYSFVPGESDALARSRRYHVKKAMQHAWAGYEKYAFGKDELRPVSMTGNKRWGGMGTTLVDSLDTLWLMDMKEEFYRARDWCKTKLDHNIDKGVSVFETTIRSMGGLLSAYDLSQDTVFLDQAEDLGKRLFQSFNTKSGIPCSSVNLSTGQGGNQKWSRGSTLLAEAGTLQLEFRALGRFSGIKEYQTRSEHVYKLLDDLKPPDGLYPTGIRNRRLKPGFTKSEKITFGAMADSFYEYLLKVWIQGGQTETRYRQMYDKSIQGMHDQLLTVSEASGLVFIADKNNGKIDYKMDHLVCFMGGLLALGAYTDPQGLLSERAQRDLKTAKVSKSKSFLLIFDTIPNLVVRICRYDAIFVLNKRS